MSINCMEAAEAQFKTALMVTAFFYVIFVGCYRNISKDCRVHSALSTVVISAVVISVVSAVAVSLFFKSL